jgi:hypothetical protein
MKIALLVFPAGQFCFEAIAVVTMYSSRPDVEALLSGTLFTRWFRRLTVLPLLARVEFPGSKQGLEVG